MEFRTQVYVKPPKSCWSNKKKKRWWSEMVGFIPDPGEGKRPVHMRLPLWKFQSFYFKKHREEYTLVHNNREA